MSRRKNKHPKRAENVKTVVVASAAEERERRRRRRRTTGVVFEDSDEDEVVFEIEAKRDAKRKDYDDEREEKEDAT